MKHQFLAAAATMSLTLSATALESDVARCDQCLELGNSVQDLLGIASLGASEKGNYHLYVIDLIEGKVESLEVARPLSEAHAEDVAVKPVSTPAELSLLVNDLAARNSKAVTMLDTIGVPKKILGSAWEMVECDTCEGKVREFLTQQFDAIPTKAEAEVLAQWTDNADEVLTSRYSVQLEAGGRLQVRVSPGSLSIDKVIDEHNNSVPFSAEELDKIHIRIGENADVIERVITKLGYGFVYIDEDQRGAVIGKKL